MIWANSPLRQKILGFNQGWDPDWDQPKKTIKTRNGSRLCYKNEKEQAEYYGEIFKQMYDDFMRK